MSGINSVEGNFLKLCEENCLHQYVLKPTRGSNILDLVLCNNENLIKNCSIFELFSQSDHSSVYFEICGFTPKQVSKTHHYNFRKGDYENLSIYLSHINWDQEFYGLSTVNGKYNRFCDIVPTAVSYFIPKSRTSIAKKSSYLSYLSRQKRKLWKFSLKDPTDKNVADYKAASLKLDLEIKRNTQKYEQRVIESGNVSQLFSYFKSKLKFNHGIGPIENDVGNLIYDTSSKEKADVFSNQFSEVFTTSHGTTPNFECMTDKIVGEMNIDPSSFWKLLQKLPNKLSSTPDQLPACLLKRIVLPVALPLSIIFNDSLTSRQLPGAWKSAIICPIYKKGSKSKAENYRPDSLTSVVCKILETMLKKHIMLLLIKEQLLGSEQHRFMPRKSTVTQLVNCISHWQWARNSRNTTDMIYLDFSKAFDKVCLEKLFLKLKCYGISGNLLEWIKNFLTGRTQAVKVEGIRSSSRPVLSGIGQGTCLGPLAFLIYINDFTLVLEGRVQFAIFADDVKFWKEIKNESDQFYLQNCLNAVVEWATTWQMTISVERCCVMKTGSSSSSRFEYHINCVPVKYVNSVKDPGVEVDATLNFSSHCSAISKKASQRAYMILRAFQSRDFKFLIRVFKVLVRPMLEYATPIWSPYLIQ